MSAPNQLVLPFVHDRYLSPLIQVHSGEIYYGEALLELHHVKTDVLKVRRSEFRKGVIKAYEFETFLCEGGKTSFFYRASKLPQALFDKYNLPSIEESAKQFSPDLQFKIRITKTKSEPKPNEFRATIDDAIDKAYKYEHLFYRSEHFERNSQILAQRFAILSVVIAHLDEPKASTLCSIHNILKEGKYSHLGFQSERGAFYSYMDRARKCKDLKRFVLGRQAINDNARKINPVVADIIKVFAGHSNCIPANKVMILVNTLITAFPKINGKKRLEIRAIETFIKENKTEINIYRGGEDYIRKVVAAYLHMHSARNPFDQFFMDEWYIEFVCKKSDKRLRKILLGMMDGASRKMVHRLKVASLNAEIIKQLLYETITLCRDRIAAELVCDFASYNVCKDIRRMLNYLVQKYKGKFCWAPTSNSNRKVEIERFWETLGSFYMSPHIGATGQGLTAKRENACPAKVIEIFIADPAFLDDETEVDRFVDHFLDMYNKKGIHAELDAPNEIFRNLDDTNSLPLEPVDIAFMFGKCYPRDYSRSEVLVEGLYYQTMDDNVSVKCHEKKVDIYRHERFSGSAFVFLKDSMEFMGELRHYDPFDKAKVNQTPEGQTAFSELYLARENGIANMLGLKAAAIDRIKSATGGVDPTEVGMAIIDQNLPQKTTTVSHLNPSAPSKIGLNPFFMPMQRSEAKEANKNGSKKKKPIPLKGLLDDTLTAKFGS